MLQCWSVYQLQGRGRGFLGRYDKHVANLRDCSSSNWLVTESLVTHPHCFFFQHSVPQRRSMTSCNKIASGLSASTPLCQSHSYLSSIFYAYISEAIVRPLSRWPAKCLYCLNNQHGAAQKQVQPLPHYVIVWPEPASNSIGSYFSICSKQQL